MGGKTGRTSKFAAAVLLVVNFAVMVRDYIQFAWFQLSCGVVFAFSLWMVSSPSSLSSAIEKIDNPIVKTLLSPQSLTVSLGVALALLSLFFFFVAFMGFYGAVTRSQFLLFMYSALILLLLLLECALLYYFSTTLMEKGLQQQDGQWTHAVRIAFRCCEDSFNVTTSEAPKIPWSCCGRMHYPNNCTASNAFKKDCKATIASWLHRYLTAIYASLAATHIVLSSCSLLRRARTHS